MGRYRIVAASFLVIVSTLLCGCQRRRGGGTLPPIEGLGELALRQVADFTKMPELASMALPLVRLGNTIYFYDSRLNQLFRSDLDTRRIIPVGRPGEGPGEYTAILGLHLEGNDLYVLDARRKVICMDTAGQLIWEEGVTESFRAIIGKKGDAFYFTEMRVQENAQHMLGLIEWTRAQGSRLLCERPIVTGRGDAIYEGKRIKGGGIFYLANPAFALIKNTLVASASEKYEFDILDLDGNVTQTRAFRTPVPELTEVMKRLDPSGSLKNYAIAKILPLDEGFLAVSNYYLKSRPRVDRFSPSGNLVSSHILPFEFDPHSKDIIVQGDCLFYLDRDNPGFRVFQISD